MTRRGWSALLIAAIMALGACQSPQSRTENAPPAPQPPPIDCTNPTFPKAISAKYPPNAKPGFDSPEAVTALLEQRWPLENVKRFAIPERRHNDAWQNLVADTPQLWSGRLYCGDPTGFDSIQWYATVESGRVREYALEATRGKDFWLLEIGSPASIQYPPRVEPDFHAGHFVGHK